MSSVKLYEGMFVFDTNLASRDWPGLESHVQDVLTKNGAELAYSERWPDRKLSYEIKGCKKGTYYLTYFRAPPSAIPGIKRDCELSERVLRLLVLYDDELVNDCEKRVSREAAGPPPEEGEAAPAPAAPAGDTNKDAGGDKDNDKDNVVASPPKTGPEAGQDQDKKATP